MVASHFGCDFDIAASVPSRRARRAASPPLCRRMLCSDARGADLQAPRLTALPQALLALEGIGEKAPPPPVARRDRQRKE